MRHDKVFQKMYSVNEAQMKLSSAQNQTRKMILGKVNKGHEEEIKKK